MQPVLEFRHDAEVAAAAADSPEQIRILLLTGVQQLAVGGHDVDAQHVVTGQSELACQAPLPATQGKPGNAGVRGGAERRGEPESLALPIELTQQHARLGDGRQSDRIDANSLHGGQIDHQAALAGGLPGEAVPAAVNRRKKIV